jgi:hypothetical protein
LLKRWPCLHDTEKELASAYHVRTVVTILPLSPRPAPLGGSPCLGPCSDTPILTTIETPVLDQNHAKIQHIFESNAPPRI